MPMTILCGYLPRPDDRKIQGHPAADFEHFGLLVRWYEVAVVSGYARLGVRDSRSDPCW